MFYLTTWESLIGHSRWALPHYTEMGHSSSSFWGTASPGRGWNPRPHVPMALNIPEGHRGIGTNNKSSNTTQPVRMITSAFTLIDSSIIDFDFSPYWMLAFRRVSLTIETSWNLSKVSKRPCGVFNENLPQIWSKNIFVLFQTTNALNMFENYPT